MAYADFDFYDWIDGLVVYEVSEEQAREIIDINTKVLAWDTEDVGVMYTLCNTLITSNGVLMKMRDELRENTGVMRIMHFERGAFVKMHRSPKDADYNETNDPKYFCSTSSLKIIRLLCLSLRIADDLREYMERKLPMKLFISPFSTPDYRREYRIFVQDGKYVGEVSTADELPEFVSTYSHEICKRAFEEHKHRAPRPTYCMDIEILDDGAYRLFEFNPLDETTDLYGFELPTPLQ